MPAVNFYDNNFKLLKLVFPDIVCFLKWYQAGQKLFFLFLHNADKPPTPNTLVLNHVMSPFFFINLTHHSELQRLKTIDCFIHINELLPCSFFLCVWQNYMCVQVFLTPFSCEWSYYSVGTQYVHSITLQLVSSIA